jgi:hypothetical protein
MELPVAALGYFVGSIDVVYQDVGFSLRRIALGSYAKAAGSSTATSETFVQKDDGHAV